MPNVAVNVPAGPPPAPVTPTTTTTVNADGSSTVTRANADGTVTTIQVPAGMQLGAGDVLIQPVTADAAWTACQTVSGPFGAAGFVCGLTWNQLEYLRELTAQAFADWCATAAALPALKGDTSGTAAGYTVGWIPSLSYAGAGFFLSLCAAANPVTIPNTDPRAAVAT